MPSDLACGAIVTKGLELNAAGLYSEIQRMHKAAITARHLVGPANRLNPFTSTNFRIRYFLFHAAF